MPRVRLVCVCVSSTTRKLNLREIRDLKGFLFIYAIFLSTPATVTLKQLPYVIFKRVRERVEMVTITNSQRSLAYQAEGRVCKYKFQHAMN